jgi:hypothetical protein
MAATPCKIFGERIITKNIGGIAVAGGAGLQRTL